MALFILILFLVVAGIIYIFHLESQSNIEKLRAFVEAAGGREIVVERIVIWDFRMWGSLFNNEGMYEYGVGFSDTQGKRHLTHCKVRFWSDTFYWTKHPSELLTQQ